MSLESEITFAGGMPDRAAHLRNDETAMARMLAEPSTRILPLWRGKPLFHLNDCEAVLAWQRPGHAVLEEASVPPVFLGLAGEVGHFALDVSAWEDPGADREEMRKFLDSSRNRHPSLPDSFQFVDLRSIMGELAPRDAGDAAVAKAILSWHQTHLFCARCGNPSLPAKSGWQRNCPSCGAQHFPRTDPVVIMLATSRDRVLLGRSPGWPEGMYSLLAGFAEPGETLEAAARREVFEEAGVRLGEVRILATQPWPFPASLMVGCASEALDDRLTLDPQEIEDARWVTRQEVMESFAGLSPALRAARRGSIARTLLEAWAAGRVAAA